MVGAAGFESMNLQSIIDFLQEEDLYKLVSLFIKERQMDVFG
jgi:hypothetical protein